MYAVHCKDRGDMLLQQHSTHFLSVCCKARDIIVMVMDDNSSMYFFWLRIYTCLYLEYLRQKIGLKQHISVKMLHHLYVYDYERVVTMCCSATVQLSGYELHGNKVEVCY